MNVPEVPKWAMPWVSPTGTVTQEALRALDRPLLAWRNGEFDAEEYYEGFAVSEMSTLEREVRKLGTRPTWRMERVWFPDGEQPAEETAAYEAACRDVAGHMIVPKCLDAYVMEAYAAGGSAMVRTQPRPTSTTKTSTRRWRGPRPESLCCSRACRGRSWPVCRTANSTIARPTASCTPTSACLPDGTPARPPL